jgi:PPOX class probable F420-dependent enzyme
MTAPTGDLSALDDPVAQQLLSSRQVARLAYTWSDGTPRVVPIWFHWNGEAVVMGTPPGAPKLKVLPRRPEVAITIDDEASWPYQALLLRGTARVEPLEDVSPEYAAAARRYFGDEGAEQWLAQLRGRPMTNVVVRPTWACVLDFVTRLPSALAAP